MRILVLGGTGAMGKHLVPLLAKGGNQVFVTSRSERPSYDYITYIKGNAQDIDFLHSILGKEEYDAIVDFMFYSCSDFGAKIPLFLSHTKQYVCISSSRVYASSDTPITEDAPRVTDCYQGDKLYLHSNDYAIEKCRLEDILQSQKSRNWTIVRPYITYSEGRLQLGMWEVSDWLYRAQKNKTIQLSEAISEKYTTLTYGKDVARGIASIIGKESCLGRVFHITSPYSIKWKDVADIYCKAIHKKTGIRPKIKFTTKDLWKSIGVTNYMVEYDRIFNRHFDNSNIGQYIDVETFVKPEEGLSKCLIESWDTQIRRIDYKRQAIMDHLTGDYGIEREAMLKDKVTYLQYRFMPFSVLKLYNCSKQFIKKAIR